MTDVEFKLHDHCEELFGDCFTGLPIAVIGPASEFSQDFEVIKRSFIGENLSKTHRLRLPALKRRLEAASLYPDDYDFVEGKILLKGFDILMTLADSDD